MKSKETIVKTYKDLVITKKSSKISVKELCQAVGISRTTFYKHFKDTYDVIEYMLVNQSIAEQRILVKEGLEPATIVEAWYVSFYKDKEFYYYAIKDESQNSLFNTLISKLLELNKELYLFKLPNDVDLEYYCYKYASIQAMLLKKWILDGMQVSPKKMTEYFMNDLLSEHK